MQNHVRAANRKNTNSLSWEDEEEKAGQKQKNEGSTTTHITGTLVETNIPLPSVV